MPARSFRLLLALLALSAWAAAASLTGTVTNATTGKPSAGDTVALLKLGQGMEESASAKTDAGGRFSIQLDDPAAPHLVRVTHQGVAYFKPAPPGSSSVEVEVYDVATKQLEGVSLTADVMSIQASASTLQVTRLFVITNRSTPPRTLMGDRPFEFYLPDGAQIDSGMAEAPGGMPLNKDPVPTAEKNRYFFGFPLRPGETRFQLAYHLPYNGQASFAPKTVMPLDHMVVMVPKSMRFTPSAGNFQSMPDKDADVHVITNFGPGQQIAFAVSGTGAMAREEGGGGGSAEGASAEGSSGAGGDNRPGGGLGPPTETPDPLHQYRLPILIALGLALTVGAFYTLNRRAIAPALAKAGGGSARVAVPMLEPEPPAPRDRSAMLLEALKEELFQLEMDRHQGRISPAEYDKAKSALDQTIARAISRRKS